MYFVRINTNNINPLIKESLNVNKSLHDEGFYTWYTLALNVFQEFDLDAEDFSNMDKCFHKIKVPSKKEFEKVVHNNYIQKTKDKLSKLTDNSKRYLYNKIKHNNHTCQVTRFRRVTPGNRACHPHFSEHPSGHGFHYDDPESPGIGPNIRNIYLFGKYRDFTYRKDNNANGQLQSTTIYLRGIK
jgi:hypothetical protein